MCMKKITKTEVKRVMKKEGNIKVGLLPSKMSPNGVWMTPTWLTLSNEIELDKGINEYGYYNCNEEVGKRVSFWIMEENDIKEKHCCIACNGTGVYQGNDCPFCNGMGKIG